VREYARGFEDAAELSLKAVREARSLEEAERKVRYLLGLVKERKFKILQEELGVF